MTAASWVDDPADLPLVYGFHYRAGGALPEIPLLTGSYLPSYGNALLPAVSLVGRR
jgi:hypothetical protein